MMYRFRQWMTRMMYGRYGVDQLGKMLSYVSLAVLLIATLFRWRFIYIIALAGIIYFYFRTFSKNHSARATENQAYMNFKYKVVIKFNNFKKGFADRKTHRIFKCPNCSQKIRVPKGKGKICIKCPKCRMEFIKKS